MNTAPVIEVFFDYILPWCYFGTVRMAVKNKNATKRLTNLATRIAQQ